MSNGAVPQRLPFTIAERSPVDRTRLRWGSLGLIGLGVALVAQGSAGVVFGILFAAVGVYICAVTHFGQVYWYDLPEGPCRWVVGPGAVIGFLFVAALLWVALFAIWLLKWIGNNW